MLMLVRFGYCEYTAAAAALCGGDPSAGMLMFWFWLMRSPLESDVGDRQTLPGQLFLEHHVELLGAGGLVVRSGCCT